MVGQTIGHYQVLEKLGEGGMGVVYLAEDTALKRKVALKVLPEQFTQDRERLARFQREAQVLASLNDPHIAAIYGLEELDSQQILVLELAYEEYRKLIEAVAHEDNVIGAYTAILGETGMRKSEGLRLRLSHIRRQERIVLIGRAKSGKVRSVPLSDLALEWLDKMVRFIDIPHVFVDPMRRRVWRDPRGLFIAGRDAAGLDWVGFHDLRHFRATQWLMNGVDVNTVRELLGHSTIQTTMRYVHYVETHATKSVVAAQ